jgi:S-adenosylmethionine:tRNA ribosyltransferase-isomerase
MQSLPLSAFTYDLPADRIALYPLPERDQSKLLVYQEGHIEHRTFTNITEYLPENTLLVFNNTRVIPARLHFSKDTGATIEIFLLSPITPSPLVAQAMLATGTATWHCTIGNLKKWTDGTVLKKDLGVITLEARLEDRARGLVAFTWGRLVQSTDTNTVDRGLWTVDITFAEVIGRSGETPLPPYLKRKAEQTDRDRYQTVYARAEGAVAAPTAGLHFTPHVLDALTQKGIRTDFLTLHVSAGTFQPVKTENAAEHTMHQEQVLVTRANLQNLLDPTRRIVPVGTTSMRTLESLYWYGVNLGTDTNAPFTIRQHDPYEAKGPLPSRHEALQRVLHTMERLNLETLTGETAIYIMPGYTFRVCDALVTNFHQPASTLILLVAAFIGEDWRKVYNEAMEKGYRFLSYGDSSLLVPKGSPPSTVHSPR